MLYKTLEGKLPEEEVIECARIEAGIDSLAVKLSSLDPDSEEAQRLRSEQATLSERLHHLARPD